MKKIVIEERVLSAVGSFFEEVGAEGCEGTAFLAGPMQDEVGEVRGYAVPQQIAGRYPDCWVEVTTKGKLELASFLPIDWLFLARIHSHPGEAFHSPTDDVNPGLTAEDSLSIVAPYFGLGMRRGIESCAVFRRTVGRWVRLEPIELANTIEIV